MQRGPPPQPCMGFRLVPELVPDLLMIWELTSAFSHLFQLPPITLPALEAAIMPGPLPRSRARPTPVLAPPGSCVEPEEVEDAELDYAHVSLAKVLSDRQNPQLQHQRRQHGEEYDPMTLLDVDGCASGLILRDLHASLVKVIDGFSIKKLHDPPDQGKLNADDNKTEMWQERIWQAVLDHKAAPECIQPGARVGGDGGGGKGGGGGGGERGGRFNAGCAHIHAHPNTHAHTRTRARRRPLSSSRRTSTCISALSSAWPSCAR